MPKIVFIGAGSTACPIVPPLERVMHFQPLSPSPFPRKQGKGSDLPLPAGGEGPQGGVNAPHMALRASRCAERVESITRSSV